MVEREGLEGMLTERALAGWYGYGVLNRPDKDYCGLVERGEERFIHVGNAVKTLALYRVHGEELAQVRSIPDWVTETVYGDGRGVCPRCHAETKPGEQLREDGSCWPRCLS